MSELSQSVWRFITDSRTKTKANSIFTLSRSWGSSNTTLNTTITINDSANDTSDNNVLQDTYAANKTSIKNSFNSCWKDERDCKSDTCSNYTDSETNSAHTILLESNLKKRKNLSNVTLRKTVNKNSTATIGYCPMKANLNHQRARWSIMPGKKKSPKYHWTGTFSDRSRKYKLFNDKKSKCLGSDIKKSPCGTELNITSCNNNTKVFKDKRPMANTIIFHSNEFTMNDELKRVDKVDKPLLNNYCHLPQNRRMEDFDIFDNIKADQDNNINEDPCPNYEVLSDHNVNLRYRTTHRDDKKNVIIDNLQKNDFYASTSSASFAADNRLSTTTNEDVVSCNIFECCRNSAKCWVNSKAKDKMSNFNKQADSPVSRPFCRRFVTFVLVVIKNIIVLSLLPTAYIAFILYVQSRQD